MAIKAVFLLVTLSFFDIFEAMPATLGQLTIH